LNAGGEGPGSKLRVENCGVRVATLISQFVTASNSSLTELCLQDTQIVSKECSVLANDHRLANLRTLDLSCNPDIGLGGLKSLVNPRSSKLANLEVLELYYCGIKGQVAGVTNKLQLTKLTSLNLSHNPLGSQLAGAILREEFGLVSPSLETLSLVNCDLQAEFEPLISNFKFMPNIYELDISENTVAFIESMGDVLREATLQLNNL